ncbi:mannosyltransferase [Arthrobacter sp. CAN_A214]
MTYVIAESRATREAPVVAQKSRVPSIAILLGVLQLIIGSASSARATFWGDEAATLTATNRTLGELAELVWQVDAVHSAYYVLQGAYMSFVGTSPLPARLTSTVVVALSVAGIVVLGSRLVSARAGTYAGVVAIFLPGLAWTSTELRSFSFTAFLAVATILLLESATRNGGAARWFAYAVALAASIWMFVFAALLILPCAVLIWSRRTMGPGLWATAAAVAASAPIIALTATQTGQVAWINQSPTELTGSVLVGQYFFGQRSHEVDSSGLVVFAWALAALTAFLLAGLANRYRRRGWKPEIVLAAAWVILPTAIIVAVTVLGKPLYQERYLTFTIPGLCILIGAALAAMPMRAGLAAAIAFCLLAAPILVTQKTEGFKPDNYLAVARFVESQKGPASTAVYSDIRTRGIALSYPERFAGVEDVLLDETASDSATFWGTNHPPENLRPDTLSGRTVFVLTLTEYPESPEWRDDPYAARLLGAGCDPGLKLVLESVNAYAFDC